MNEKLEKRERLIAKLSKPLSVEEIKSIIFNAFGIIIFLLPIIPEIIGMCLYSLRNTLFNLTTIVTSIILILLNIKQRKKYEWNIYDVLMGIYLIFVLLSTVFTKYGVVNAVLGLNGRGEGLITISSYVATFCIFSKGYKYIKKTVKFALIGAIIVSIYSFIQANVPINIELPFTPNRTEGMAVGTMKNRNFLSSYICIFLPAMCYYYINSKNHKSLLVVALLFMTQVFTVTLGGYISFIVMFGAIVIFSICYSKNKRETILTIVILTFVIVTIFYTLQYMNGNAYSKELCKSKTEVDRLVNKSEKFGTNRLAIWKRTLMAIENNKILGVGPDSLKEEFENEKYHILGTEDMLSRKIVDKAHCEYLHVAVTTGIPSLVVYLMFLVIICFRLFVIVIKSNKKCIDDSKTQFVTLIFIAIISYLGQALGNISVVQVAPVFWAILGIGAGITLNENNKSEIEK